MSHIYIFGLYKVKMSPQSHILELSDIKIEVTFKSIKNVHLSVRPGGVVRISAPRRMSLAAIRAFAVSKLDWIQKHRTKMKHKKRETPKEYITGETHLYLGKSYTLEVLERNTSPKVILADDTLTLFVRPGSTKAQRETLLYAWYKSQMSSIVSPRIVELEKIMHVKVNEMRFRTMKTKWGTCNTRAKRIWLNTELAKRSVECIEYVLVHEMVHLLEH